MTNITIISRLIGFFILLCFIWVRFLRNIIPQTIPFNLTLWSLIVLLFIVIMYLYNIYKLLLCHRLNSNYALLQFLFKPFLAPLVALHEFILSNAYTEKVLLFLSRQFLLILNIDVRYHNDLFVYLYFFLLPRVMLLFCLCIDCLYYEQLNIIYSCSVLLIIPLMLRYCLYCNSMLLEKHLIRFNSEFIVEITSKDMIYNATDYDKNGFLKNHLQRFLWEPSTLDYDSEDYKYLMITKFMDYQADARYFKDKCYEYNILYHNERQDDHDLESSMRYSLDKRECYDFLEYHINMILLEKQIKSGKEYYFFPEGNWTFTEKMDIVLNTALLMCWIYILYKSFHTLKDIPITLSILDLLTLHSKEINPFINP